MIEKVWIRILSILKYLSLKCCYGKRIALGMVNPIRGKLRIEMTGFDSHLTIGRNLMSMGPLNIKVKGKLKIGSNCFFNHNVCIT